MLKFVPLCICTRWNHSVHSPALNRLGTVAINPPLFCPTNVPYDACLSGSCAQVDKWIRIPLSQYHQWFQQPHLMNFKRFTCAMPAMGKTRHILWACGHWGFCIQWVDQPLRWTNINPIWWFGNTKDMFWSWHTFGCYPYNIHKSWSIPSKSIPLRTRSQWCL